MSFIQLFKTDFCYHLHAGHWEILIREIFVLKKSAFLDRIFFPEIIQLNNISESDKCYEGKNRVGN